MSFLLLIALISAADMLSALSHLIAPIGRDEKDAQ